MKKKYRIFLEKIIQQDGEIFRQNEFLGFSYAVSPAKAVSNYCYRTGTKAIIGGAMRGDDWWENTVKAEEVEQ